MEIVVRVTEDYFGVGLVDGDAFTPAVADTRPAFRIDNPDLKGLLGLPLEGDAEKHTDGKSFSWEQVRVKLEDLQGEARRAGAVEEAARDAVRSRRVDALAWSRALHAFAECGAAPERARLGKELQGLVSIAPAGRDAAEHSRLGNRMTRRFWSVW